MGFPDLPSLNIRLFMIKNIPFAIAPITTQIGSSVSGTISDGLATLSAVYDINNFLQPIGKWSVIGFFITFNSFIDESDALTENL